MDTQSTSMNWLRRNELFIAGVVLLLFMGVFSIFAVLSAPFNTATWMRHGIVFFSNREVLAILLGGIACIYGWFIIRASSMITDAAQLKRVLIITGAIVLVLFMAPPFFSSDVFGYIVRAGAAQLHQVSIYGPTPAQLGYGDVVAWPEGGWVYGPLITLVTLGLRALAGNDVLVNLVVFRLAGVIGLGVGAWLLYRIVSRVRPDFRYPAVALFLLNPFILFEVVQSAHNDIWMLVLVLGFIDAMVRRWYVLAACLVCASFLIKFGTIILLPIPLWCMMRQLPWRTALIRIGTAVGACIGLVMLAYAPFGNIQANLGNLGRAFIEDNFLTVPQTLIISAERMVSTLIPSFVVNLATVRAGYLFVFVAVYIVLFFYPGLDKKYSYIVRSFWMVLIFLFLLGGKFNIWYILWGLPLTLAIPHKRYTLLLLLMTGYGFLYYVILNVLIPNLIFCLAVAGWAYWNHYSTSADPMGNRAA